MTDQCNQKLLISILCIEDFHFHVIIDRRNFVTWRLFIDCWLAGRWIGRKMRPEYLRRTHRRVRYIGYISVVYFHQTIVLLWCWHNLSFYSRLQLAGPNHNARGSVHCLVVWATSLSTIVCVSNKTRDTFICTCTQGIDLRPGNKAIHAVCFALDSL